jgi:tetratricopeptide (TPR) repeat protein
VLGKVLDLDDALRPSVAALLALLDSPVEDPEWQAHDPIQRRQLTLDAVKRLLLRESQEQPLLLVFEDLHWIDTETQALLDSLVESLPTARVLLLVNYRPEYEHTWHRKTYYQQLRLDPLPPESAEELLGALLGDGAELQPLKRVLIERTEGNPFFAEESVRTLVESGVLAGQRGSYRLVRPLASTQVPATVQAVLAARIDRLAPADKRLLQAAAAIGKDVPFVLLQAIWDASESGLREGLRSLQAAEFLYETSLFPDLEYTFKHALTHEVAYGSLLQERRQALHAQLVGVVEALYPDRRAEQVERLAHHAFKGGAWTKAVIYSRQAGTKAFARSANREAVQYFEQALAALEQLPESRAKLEQAVDLRIDLRNALWPLGQFRRILDHLHQAQALAEALAEPHRLGHVSSYLAGQFWRMGDHTGAIASGERALAIGTAVGDFTITVVANLYLGLAHHAVGSYRQAIAVLSRNVASLDNELMYERFGMPGLPSVVSRTWVIWCLAELGDFAEATARGEEAIRIAAATDQPYSLTTAYLGVGLLDLHRGNPHQAIAWLERGRELCRAVGLVNLLTLVITQLGQAYARSGRVVEAISLLEECAQQTASEGEMYPHSQSVIPLGEAYLRAGRRDDAAALARRALELTRHQKERGYEAHTLWLLGEIAADADPLDVAQADTYYQDALTLAEELGMRPLTAHCHLGLGTLYQKVGRGDEASVELATASEMYRAMEMPFWLAKAEVALAQVGAA